MTGRCMCTWPDGPVCKTCGKRRCSTALWWCTNSVAGVRRWSWHIQPSTGQGTGILFDSLQHIGVLIYHVVVWLLAHGVAVRAIVQPLT